MESLSRSLQQGNSLVSVLTYLENNKEINLENSK